MDSDLENGDRYLVGAFLQACQVMAAFRRPGDLLRLRDIVARTRLPKGTVFRLVYTLHSTGFIEKTSHNEYRLRVALPKRSKLRLGYAGNAGDPFTRLVTEGLVQAAHAKNLELLVLDNRNDATIALRNADLLVREHVDMAVESQADQSVAEALWAKFESAGVPLITIDVPHPGAVYFGANNFEAGTIAGRKMGRWTKLHWPRDPLDIVLIGYTRAGPFPQTRVKGMLAGFRETCGPTRDHRVFHLDSIGDFDSAREAVSHHLDRIVPRKTLVGAVCDQAALGALKALTEVGLREWSAVIGQGAEPDVRAELRRADSRMIGSVAYFPERYGKGIIALAWKILGGAAPSVVFTKHVLVTPENVDRVYPNDGFVRDSCLENYESQATSCD